MSFSCGFRMRRLDLIGINLCAFANGAATDVRSVPLCCFFCVERFCVRTDSICYRLYSSAHLLLCSSSHQTIQYNVIVVSLEWSTLIPDMRHMYIIKITNSMVNNHNRHFVTSAL